MLFYGRTDASTEIDVNRTNESRMCFICNYYYFLKKNSRFQPTVFVKGNDYRSIFKHTSKDKAINIMKNSDLSKKVGSL